MNTPLSQLIAEMLMEKRSFGWDKYTHNMLDDLIEKARLLMDAERNNIMDAYIAGENDGAYSHLRAVDYFNRKYLTDDTENVSA